METQHQEPSLLWKKIQHQHQENETNMSFDFPDKELHKNPKDYINEPDIVNVNKTTSNLDDINSNGKTLSQDIDNIMESVDLSDLMFSCNDFILGDCTCFEQASQLVDPTLKDSESTPFSFNNSDSVQLFRFSLSEDNLSKYIDNLIGDKNDHYNFYKVFEMFDGSLNKEKSEISRREKGIKRRKDRGGPIKKGRRYLPNFKQKVLEYTKTHSFKETAVHFKINCNTITEWSRESKRLSLSNNKTSLPGSNYNNYKTDIVGTPDSKTEIILLNDVISFETDLSDPWLKSIEDDLPPEDMSPEERFMKWVEGRRLQRKELTRQEVYQTARCCLKRRPVGQDKASWFFLWFKRFNKALKNPMKTEAEKYIRYPNSFKLEVALYARIFTKNSAARVFNVPRRRMFDWFNCLNPLKDSFGKNDTGETTNGKDDVSGTKKDKTKSKIYSELHLWYQKRFLSGARPTSLEIKEKGKEIFSSHGISGVKFSDGWLQKFCQRTNIKLRHSEDDRLLLWVLSQLDNNVSLSHQDITDKSSSLVGKSNFKGSKGWTLRFLKRHRNFLQLTPSVQDQLPQIAQEKLNQFWDSFRHTLSSFQIGPNSIGCMDEVPISFNYPEDGKGSSLPLLRKTGFENCQGIVILSTLATGRVLPPAVVFKGKGPKQLMSSENVDILILYQEKGSITAEVLEAWFNDIWLSCSPAPSVLVVDSFQPHRTLQWRQLLAKDNCLLQIIPEGCSSRFQPLDVELTPLFKEVLKNLWKECPKDSNVVRRYRCPDEDTILGWVQKAYKKVVRNPVSIINSFKSTGLLQ